MTADPAGERRQAGGAEHRHRRRQARHPRPGRRRHGLRAVTRCARSSQPFADPEVGAVSGNTKVGNRRGLLGRWQHIEYVIGFNLDRRMFDVLRCMPTVPGAIGAFRREALTAVGGVSDETLAEDTDLTMATCRAGWRVVYAPEARAWTEAPATLGQLWRQRYRWCYGTMQAMWKHRRRRPRVRRCRQARPARPALPAARSRSCCRLLAPADRRLRRSTRSFFLPPPPIAYGLAGLPGPAARQRRLRVPAGPRTRSRRCGACRSSSSSTGS